MTQSQAHQRISQAVEELELSPNVVTAHTKAYDSMKAAHKKVLLDWINDNFEPSTRIAPFTTYVLRQMFLNSLYATDGGDTFNVSNAQFKAAMLDAGFKPAALEAKAGKAHWRFYLKMDKANQNAGEVLATEPQARVAEGTMAVDEQNELDATAAATANDIAGSLAEPVTDPVQPQSPGTEQTGKPSLHVKKDE